MDKVLLNTENYQVRAFLRGLWQKIQRYGKMLAAVTRHIVEILSACSFSITQHVAQAYTHRKNHSLHTFDYVVFQHCKTISHNPLVRSSTLRGGTKKTLLHPLRCFVDVLSAPIARNSIAYTVWQSSNTCLALSQRD
jgi:hypothetical protein